jgi:Family of unknown function (DUF6232)
VTVTVFYRGLHAVITQEFFETTQPARLQFTIKDFTDVHIVRIEPPLGEGRRSVGLSTLAAALLVVPLVGLVSQISAGLAAVVFLSGSLLSLRRRKAVRWELVATLMGRPVTLFESDDRTEFDQVCRALRRALEQQVGDR